MYGVIRIAPGIYINPICPVCKGILRGYVDHHRRQLGLSFHRVCCCACVFCTTGSTVDVTITLGAICCPTCCGSATPAPGTGSAQVAALSGVNGTYNFPITASGGGACTYSGTITGVTYTAHFWAPNNYTCAGAPTTTWTASTADFFVIFNVDLEVTDIQINLDLGGGDSNIAYRFDESIDAAAVVAACGGSIDENWPDIFPCSNNDDPIGGFAFNPSASGGTVVLAYVAPP